VRAIASDCWDALCSSSVCTSSFAGLLGVFGGSFGSPIVSVCNGPQCAIGVDRGVYGPFIGVGLIIAGVLIARPAGFAVEPCRDPDLLAYIMNR